MVFNAVLPWVLLALAACGWAVPSAKLSRNAHLLLLGFQLLFCLVAIVLCAVNMSAYASDPRSAPFVAAAVGLCAGIVFALASVWRRKELARSTIFGG